MENLSKSFPEKSHEELKAISRKFYKNFCDAILEVFKSLSIRKETAAKRFKLVNPSLLDDLHAEGKSAFLFAGHMLGWEWFNLVQYFIQPQCVGIYKRHSSAYFNGLNKLVRSSHGAINIEMKETLRKIIELKNTKKSILVLSIGDQRPFKVLPDTPWLTFLNQDTPFISGTERIAQKLKMELIFPYVKKIKRGYYEVEFQTIGDDLKDPSAEDLIKGYAKKLEQNIQAEPSLWLWTHKRWKHKR